MTISVEVNFSHKEDLVSLENLQRKNLENINRLKESYEDDSEDNSLWYNWPENEGKKLASDLDGINSQLSYYYDLVVVIGIGGSYTGTKAIHDLFGTSLEIRNQEPQKKPILFCGYHLSESYLQKQLRILDQYKPVVCVVSKSGKTLEPNAIYSVISTHLKKRFSHEEILERTFFISSKKESPFLDDALPNKPRYFSIPDQLVGRFSVLSAASLVPLALAGHNIKALMRGADDFFRQLEAKEEHILKSLIYAPARFLAWKAGKSLELLAYEEPQLEGFGLWWQQLFAESEGKQEKAIFPISSLFSRDLHSIGQYIQEGSKSIFETFLMTSGVRSEGNLESESRIRVPTDEFSRELLGKASGHYLNDLNEKIMKASKRAHSLREVPNCTLQIGVLNESTLGFLIAFFQTTCVLGSFLLEVNPYNQPGVEAYKKELLNLLS